MIVYWKALFVHNVCANFGLNTQSECTNFSLNTHSVSTNFILVVKYRHVRALFQLASDTVMFLGLMHSAANQGVRKSVAAISWFLNESKK